MITLVTNGHPLHEISCKTLAGYLQSFNIKTNVVYLNHSKRLTSILVNRLVEISKNSRLIAVSLMSKDFEMILPFTREIRKKMGIPVIFGGIHPSVMPKESLEESDFVCISEGEEPLRMLYEHIVNGKYDLHEIPNIGYIDHSGQYIKNGQCFSVEALDELPFPDYKFENSYFLPHYRDGRELVKIPSKSDDKFNLFNKCNNFMFYSQRGCKLGCTYCSNSFYHKIARETGVPWMRFASVERIKRELKSHLNSLPFVKYVVINDDDFLARDADAISEITEFLKNELKVVFSINAIPKYVNEETMSLMVKNGLKQICMGVQSGSDRILKKVYGRPVTGKAVLEASKIIEKYYPWGLKADYGFILDNPYENDDDLRESIKLMIALPRPLSLSLYSLAFFPGTTLTNKALLEKMILDPKRDMGKHYHDSIKPTYGYFLFLINSSFRVPSWINDVFISDLFYKSTLFGLLRTFLGYTTLVLRLRIYIKTVFRAIFAVYYRSKAILKNGSCWIPGS